MINIYYYINVSQHLHVCCHYKLQSTHLNPLLMEILGFCVNLTFSELHLTLIQRSKPKCNQSLNLAHDLNLSFPISYYMTRHM